MVKNTLLVIAGFTAHAMLLAILERNDPTPQIVEEVTEKKVITNSPYDPQRKLSYPVGLCAGQQWIAQRSDPYQRPVVKCVDADLSRRSQK